MSYDPDAIAGQQVDQRIAETAAVIQKDSDARETSLRLAIDAVDNAGTARLEAAFSTLSEEVSRKADLAEVEQIQAELEAKIDTKADKPPEPPPDVEPVKL